MPKKTIHHQRQRFSQNRRPLAKRHLVLRRAGNQTPQSVLQQNQDRGPAENHNYIAQFNAEVRNSDESQKTIKDSLTHWLQVFKFPSVERTTYDRLECTAQHQVFPLIGEKIVGDITAADLKSVLNHWMEQGLRLHHSEESPYPAERILSLLNGGRFHPEEPHAIGANDEESKLSLPPRTKSVCQSRSR